jgi:hypothetical protein
MEELGVVRVTWLDANFEFDSDGSAPEDYEVDTVGHFVSQGLRFLTLAGEILPDGSYRAVSHIPTVLVRTLTPLA